jgi:hypothetical protein
MRANTLAVAAFLAAASMGTAAYAGPNLVNNGNFSQTTYGTSNQFGTGFGGQGVTGWTGNGGYNLLFMNGTATTNSANSQYDNGYNTGSEKLYGPAGNDEPVGGGNFVALDGDPTVGGGGGISQTITTVIGTTYQLTFQWGAGQLQSRSGPTTSSIQASFGNQTQSTAIVANPPGGFSGWMTQTFNFTATATSELLSFLSVGTPTGLPPIATLSNVSLVAVPEPMSMSLLGAGLVGLGIARRRRNKA